MLIPAKTISVQDWMRAPEIVAVFDVLQDAGLGPQVLIVGGAVRNTIIGLPPGDCDLATVYSPDQVTARLTGAGIKVVPTGIDHGTVTAVINSKTFEITTLRRDVKTDGRHAVVTFTADWREDAKRRDFTINTLLMDLNGKIFDPIRSGIIDLEKGKIIFVGDPAQRIAEDHLRILRFFRFHALYGKGAPDRAALDACRAAAQRVSSLSRERITQELIKILCVSNPEDILEIMFENKVMVDVLHPKADLGVLRRLCDLQNQLDIDNSCFESRLSVLAAGHTDHVPVFEKYLSLSRVQSKLLDLCLNSFSGEINLQECLYRNGREAGAQMALMNAAARGHVLDHASLDMIRNWVKPVFPLSGDDLKDIGVPPGPGMGRILSEIESWWVESGFKQNRAQCLDRARDRIQG